MGHERFPRAAHVRQEGRADLPRPRDRAAPGLQRGHRHPHRSGDQADRDGQLRQGEDAAGEQPRHAAQDRRRAAHSRIARRRSGQGARRGQGAGRAHPEHAGPASLLADRGSAPPPEGTAVAHRADDAEAAAARVTPAQQHIARRLAIRYPPRATHSGSPFSFLPGCSPGCFPGSRSEPSAVPRDYTIPLPNGRSLALGPRTLVMGILNVTPDSFADGGLYTDPARALAAAEAMLEAGVDIIDVGGESTRPGAAAVDMEEELRRVLPVIRAVAARTDTPISIDTYKAPVARAALDAGASLVND